MAVSIRDGARFGIGGQVLHVTGLAIVLLVILILILVVLFRPITYSVDLSTRHPYKAAIRIEWWGKMFLIHFAYEEDKPFFKEVYVLRKARLGALRDYEDWLSRRVKEETADPMDFPPEDARTQAAEAKADEVKQKDEVKQAVPPTKPTAPIRLDADGKPLDSYSETIKTADEDTKIDANETTTPSDDGSETKATPEDPYKRWWLKHLTNEALYEQLMIITRRTYDHSKPRQFDLEGRFGNGDPYFMGIVAAMMYSIWPEKMSRVELTYTERTFRGTLLVSGAIYPGVMAWYGTLFVASKPVRTLLVDVVKAGLRYRKRKKEKEKANDSSQGVKTAV